VGVVSDPVVSSRGVHLLRVDSINADGRRAISQIFLPIEVSQADLAIAEEKIKAARKRIMDGEQFSEVAKEVSADPISAANGGLLGTFVLADLSSQFQEVLQKAWLAWFLNMSKTTRMQPSLLLRPGKSQSH